MSEAKKLLYLRDEIEEIRRTSQELNIPFKAIFDCLYNGKFVKLTDDIWSHLENTDSYQITGFDDVAKLSGQYERDWARIWHGMTKNDDIPPPIVIQLEPDRYYLIAGNTRLMVSRAMKRRPVILLGRLNR